MPYKIEFDEEKCLGCGACTQCNNWKLGDDGKAYPQKTELDEIGRNKEVEEICPVDAIKVIKTS